MNNNFCMDSFNRPIVCYADTINELREALEMEELCRSFNAENAGFALKKVLDNGRLRRGMLNLIFENKNGFEI